MKMIMVKSKVFIDSIWSFIERFSVQGLQFLFSIILARLLSPSDYGLIAMLSIFWALSQTLLDCGFSNALIRKIDRTDIDKSTVFFYNILSGVLLYFALFFLSPYIALFYEMPIWELLLRYMSIIIPINAISLTHRTLLQIQCDYKLQVKISLLSIFASGTVGVIFAFYGFGVWGLVVQSLLNSLFATIMYWVFVKWQPKLLFSMTSLKKLFLFGNNILLSGLLRTFYVNIYSLVIGKFFTPLDLGFYSRADSLSQFTSTNLTMALIRVFYPSLCECQNDRVMLINMYYKYMKILCLVIFPIVTLLIGLASPLVIVLLGDKWVPSIYLLQILLIGYIFYPIYNLNNAFWQSINRPDMVLKAEFMYKVIGFSLLLITLPFGLKCLAWGTVCTSIITFIISFIYTMNSLKISVSEVLLQILKILLLSIFMFVVVRVVVSLFCLEIYQLFFGAIIGISSFFLFDYLTFRVVFKTLKNE
ncbi:lipopolysaccharide biosynthesis protein [Bacteroides fragilis]|nr:lipopolysaccharide biosynthesis protein [Bacteroides fragilis]